MITQIAHVWVPKNNEKTFHDDMEANIYTCIFAGTETEMGMPLIFVIFFLHEIIMQI